LSKVKPVRLIVFDVDGVLTRSDGKGLDLPLLELLADFNQAAQEDPSRPAVTLCTGRSAAYAEALLQAIHGHLPAVYENGAGLYVPDLYHFLPHPDLDRRSSFQEVRRRLEERLVRTGQGFFQPGKEFSLSILPGNPVEIDALYDRVVTALGSLSDMVDLVYSVSCLNVLPRGMHKGKGVEFLAHQTGYTPEEMLGVGDSDVDLPFLALVGYNAAPANANPAVKQSVQYVAPRLAANGVRDILDHFGLPLSMLKFQLFDDGE
jgi:HAD superfamily hydrolase (TIGR01484 family)